ncbi:MAG: methionyl-tRNA formyltransferase [Candidatus Paceibacterota bacterium]|jgi:methionyl-tRNA formyltransferase
MLNKNLKFVFFGTPDVSSETLDILKKNGYIPSLIITSTDKPQGRKMLLTPPPVKTWAIENNIQYLQPEKIDTEKIWDIFKTQNIPDLFIVVAYGKILPEKLLNLPKLGSINIHYSLLPKYRGASPVESAILNGDTETGITIQKMEFKMDSGPIIAKETIEILPDEKAIDLRKKLIKIGGELLIKILPDIIENKIQLNSQDEAQATYCKKIKKEDGLIDLNDDSIKNYNKFRAYSSWPRTFFFKNNKRIIITDALLENEEFKILKILPEGKKEIDYKNFISSNL